MSHNTIVHRLMRPLVRPLVGTRIEPDHLTLLRLLTGLAAAALFAAGRPPFVLAGTVVFLMSACLDRADGELARQSRRFSARGHRWDLLADCGVTVLVFVGLGVGAATSWLGAWAPVLGVAAGVGAAVLFWTINVVHVVRLPAIGSRATGRVLVDPDDAIFLVPVILWLAGPTAVLVPAGTVTPVLAALVLLQSARCRRAA